MHRCEIDASITLFSSSTSTQLSPITGQSMHRWYRCIEVWTYTSILKTLFSFFFNQENQVVVVLK
jgi:hypothetical protein